MEKLDKVELKKKKCTEYSDPTKYKYDYECCMSCIKENLGKTEDKIRSCPHCGSENYDSGCIPAIVQKGIPNNCIPKSKFTIDQASKACLGVSSEKSQCDLIDKQKSDEIQWMKDECGKDHYYCAFDETDSCPYKLCKMDDYYSYSKSSICNCEPCKSATDIMGNGWGRECLRGNNCEEYYPLRKAPELFKYSEKKSILYWLWVIYGY